MPDHSRPFDAEKRKGCRKQFGLLLRAPGVPPGPGSVAKPRPVEHDGAVRLSGMINNAADQHVVNHSTIAVQEDDWRAAATLHIVKAYAIGSHERATGGVIAFGLGCATICQQGGAREG